jgi:hypothetical protein
MIKGVHTMFYSSEPAALRARGVEFKDAVSDRGYGLAIHFAMPGGVEVELYQPRYEKRRRQ